MQYGQCEHVRAGAPIATTVTGSLGAVYDHDYNQLGPDVDTAVQIDLCAACAVLVHLTDRGGYSIGSDVKRSD